MTEYSVDGFRFDGVTSMIYKHHGKFYFNKCKILINYGLQE